MESDDKVLEKVLLHPRDKAGFESNPLVKDPKQILLPENFWKNRDKRRSKRSVSSVLYFYSSVTDKPL